MNKLGIWAIVIAGAFLIGIVSANPVVEAVGGWQLAFDGLDARITGLENQPADPQIMRIDGGGIIGVGESYFLNGGSLSRNFASTMVGIDGTISEVQYRIGFATVNGATVTAKIFKNGGIVGS